MKITVDTRGFGQAMKRVIADTGKDSAEVLNRAGRNVSLRAMQFTPFVPANKIRAELTRKSRAMRGARGQILGKVGGKRRREFKASLLVYSIINARRRNKGQTSITGAEMSAAAQRFIRARMSSSKYIRAGFIKAAHAFGGAKNLKVYAKGLAARGFGQRATPRSLLALIVNRSRGANTVAAAPLERAVNYVIKDMVAHARKTYQATFDKVKP